MKKKKDQIVQLGDLKQAFHYLERISYYVEQAELRLLCMKIDLIKTNRQRVPISKRTNKGRKEK